MPAGAVGAGLGDACNVTTCALTCSFRYDQVERNAANHPN